IEPLLMKFKDCVAVQQQDTGHYLASMQLAGKIDCPSGKAEENPWIDKPVSGQLKYDSQGQRILTTNEFKKFRDEMAKQDIKVVVDTKEKRLPKNVAAGFDFETKEIILRPDATKVSAIHESYHVKQYMEIGKEKYKQLPAIEREEYVYNEIMKNKGQFNSAEIHESQRVIFKYRNGYWPTENWKGFGE
ncbi:zincin-like metallopeptidase toxin domain-containing protein, partial [Thermoactinomyces sp. DSM 45892]|uniref:zincin-like metallopeptidase toxin domain-containing protein n=1 Tax=Thermoactinomyces sp. DSM 45892 TaxID=1882753 RepID=UPI00089C583D